MAGTGGTSGMHKFAVPSPASRRTVEAAIRAVAPVQARTEQSCEYRFDIARGTERVVVKQYCNGTLFLQSASPSGLLMADLVEAIDRTVGTKTVIVGGAAKRDDDPDLTRPFPGPWIGSDEAGKGDYFGPLVVAAVWVDDRMLGLLEALGVRDSKVVADTEIARVAAEIIAIGGDGVAVVEVPPARYNTIYRDVTRQGRNLNDLLAWGHAKAIGEVRKTHPAAYALVDRFGDRRHLDGALARQGEPPLEVMHAPRAESNLAVAAASILARDEYVTRMERLEREYEVPLPKGAAKGVEVAGRTAMAKHGAEVLPKIAKMHFRTAYRVLGLPEPAASTWVRGGRAS